MDLDAITFDKLYNAIYVIKSEEQIYRFEAASFPNLKSQDRTKTHKKHHKKAFPSAHKKRILKSEDAAMYLRNKLGG